MIPTLLAAHVVPQEYAGKTDDYVKLVCEQMIPLVTKKKLAKYVDVFCDRGAFTQDQSKEYCRRRASTALARVRTSANLRRQSSSRCWNISLRLSIIWIACSRKIFRCWHKENLLRSAAGSKLFLGHKEFPDARRLIDAGVALALATDYNPGTSPTPSMPFVSHRHAPI